MNGIRKTWEDICVGDIIIAQPCVGRFIDNVEECISFQITFVGERYTNKDGVTSKIFEGQFADGRKLMLEDVPVNDKNFHSWDDDKIFFVSVEAMIHFNF